MPAKQYQVELTTEESASLEQMLRRGNHSTRKLTRARILLKAASGLSDEEIAQEVETCGATIERTRQRVAAGRLKARQEAPRPGRKRCLDDRGAARLMAAACSPAPEG